jgi:NitT/TauT family transport system substrate-binding protein
MRRPLACALLAAALVLALAGGARAQALRLGILPVLDTLPLHVAAREGLFAAQGLDVELVPFASAMERDTAMQSGQLDGYFGDLVATLTLIRAGVPMRVATVSYRTTPGQRMFAVVASPKGAAEGAPLGYSRTTVMEFLLERMAPGDAAGGQPFTRMEVKKIPIRMQMLMAGQLGYAILPEPLASLVESRGGRVLATDEALDLPLTVVCLRQERMGACGAFLAAYSRAVEALTRRPEDFRDLMARECRMPDALAAAFPVYRYPAPSLPTEAEVAQVQDWMLRVGLLEAPLPYAAIVPQP